MSFRLRLAEWISVCRRFFRPKQQPWLSTGTRRDSGQRRVSNTPCSHTTTHPSHTVSTATMATQTWGLHGKKNFFLWQGTESLHTNASTHTHTCNTQWHTLIQWLCKHNSWLTSPLFCTFCSQRPFWPALSKGPVPLNSTAWNTQSPEDNNNMSHGLSLYCEVTSYLFFQHFDATNVIGN